MLRLYLVRHGQSLQQTGACSSWDSELSGVGQVQAELLAAWLASEPRLDARETLRVSAVSSSPLRRAAGTARCVGAALALSVEHSESLCEAPFHVSDGLPRSETPWDAPAPRQVAPEHMDFRERVVASWRGLLERGARDTGARVAITHGGVIKTGLRALLGVEASSFRLYNTGLTVLEWSEGRWRLLAFNLCEHLPPDLRTR